MDEQENQEYFYLKNKDIYSTQSLLASFSASLEDSIYADSSNDFLRWPFNAADFFELQNSQSSGNEAASGFSESAQKELEEINLEIKSYKFAGTTIENQERIKKLRVKKKALMAESASPDFLPKKSIIYKTFVEINDHKMVEKKLPHFKNTKWPFREQMPYFVSGLEDFEAAIERGEPTAITGGPCFFGEYEVDMVFTMKDGSEKVYDFTTRRRTATDRVSQEAEFTKKNAGEVLDVSFRNHKKLLDTEEYDSILYLFELAKATGSALTIPTVDFAYEKYLDAMIESLPEQIQKNARARFREVADSIIEMYDRLFEFFKARYPEVKCAMMSSKNKDLLELYYSKRRPFVDKTATRRIISGIQEKIESVKDYITLPALPYYFWGIKNVLEVDYLGETDSFWKCRKMHKGEMKLSALLYPIKISADGWRTLFSTERQYKEYIKEEDYGKR